MCLFFGDSLIEKCGRGSPLYLYLRTIGSGEKSLLEVNPLKNTGQNVIRKKRFEWALS